MLKLNISKQLPLLNQSITNINALLKSGEITSVDLVKATIQRIKDTKVLNAFITITEDQAIQQAQQSAQRFKNEQYIGILDGVPLSFKDNFSTKDISTTCGSKMLSNYIPPFDATVVERLLESGVVMMGKTNMDEFAMGSACSESYFGPTYNPWNCNLKFKLCNQSDGSIVHTLDQNDDKDCWYIAGGSSGGSAVSVAIGASFAALSSDTGGSTRNPASRVGIVGFKPSYGLISRFGLIPLTHSLDVPGIMARNVQDVETVFSHLHGNDKRDSTTANVDLSQTSPNVRLKKLRIGIPNEYRCNFLDKNICKAWDDTIEILSNNGATIVPISLPHTKYSLACYSILNTCEVASNFACYDGIQYGYRADKKDVTFEECYTSTREESFNDIVKSRIISGNYFLLKQNYEKYYNKALKLRRLIADDFTTAFRDVDFMLTPVTVTSTMNFAKWSQMDKTEEAIKEDYCTQPTNMAGIPAISIPVKLDDTTKLPIGIQIIANKFDDYRLLKFAKQLESLIQFPHLIFDQ
ncbi:hypothetical protein RDWZM_002008 [Blomia tropicalis]|uniref:Glutamyl-tRNA(Gln) amidotransferase subunit A, mitochondrial n=1 Tax=Blomia tropicalis TaxID=40697 RepID=A0A9Q0RPI1_BLOTA|nr:hypothetical protein RDWZM_002008 [Blomia tropicalis]